MSLQLNNTGSALMNATNLSVQNKFSSGLDTSDSMARSASSSPNTDIFFRNYSTGENQQWNMQGSALVGQSTVLRIDDPNWQMVATGDFDGNGKNNDYLWRNKGSGENAIWLMDGSNIADAKFLPQVSDQAWEIKGVGDFNVDGKSDIVWRNARTGENAVWLIDNTAIKEAQFLTQVSDRLWDIVGVGDFNGDGKDELLWRNDTQSPSGQNAVWQLNGATLDSSYFLTNPSGSAAAIGGTKNGWKVAGVADLTGDGKAEIVWGNRYTGASEFWSVNSNQTATATLGSNIGINPKGNNARIVGLSDFNGDGKADLMWRNHATGNMEVTLMGGTNTTVTQQGGFQLQNLGKNWSVGGLSNSNSASFVSEPVYQSDRVGSTPATSLPIYIENTGLNTRTISQMFSESISAGDKDVYRIDVRNILNPTTNQGMKINTSVSARNSGLAFKLYRDSNSNGILESNEQILVGTESQDAFLNASSSYFFASNSNNNFYLEVSNNSSNSYQYDFSISN